MRYRSRPSEVDAVRWEGTNIHEVLTFAGEHKGRVLAEGDGFRLEILAGLDGAQGFVPVPIGHWVVSQPDDRRDIWPVDHDYFTAKYEAA